MSTLASFSIQSESHPALDPVAVSPGSLSVGRGPLLKVTDRSVSRSHANISLNTETHKLAIRSVHTNPTFVYKVGSDKAVVLNRDQEIELLHGDRISLLPDKLFFRIINSNKIGTSSKQTLYLPTGNETDATQPIDGDLLELASPKIDTSETLYLPMGNETDATQPIDGDLLELASPKIDTSDTLYLPMGNETDATQPIDGDLLELASPKIDTSDTLYLPMGNETDGTQSIDGDLLELASPKIDTSETLYLPMGNETDGTQPIDGDHLELASPKIDTSDTLYLPMGNETDGTQSIDGDLLELASPKIDTSETLYLPMGNETDGTQPIDGDHLELASPKIDTSETLYLPMGNETDGTQPIDGDLLELASPKLDTSETLYLPMGNETDGTQPIDGDLLELASPKIDTSETLCVTEKAPDSNTMDSESSASMDVPHKKRKLPLWMLEDTKSDPPARKKIKPTTMPTSSIATSKGASSAEEHPTHARPVASDNSLGTVGLESSATVAPSLSTAEPSPTHKPSDEPASIALPACPYGAECYRKNPTHFNSYSHPSKEDKAKDSTATKECPYGSKCYRKNPEHLKEFSHSPRGSSARERKPRAAKAKKHSVLDGASDDDGATNSYDLKDDFIDNSGSSDASDSTEVESSESDEWRPSEDVTDLVAESRDFINNPKMIRK